MELTKATAMTYRTKIRIKNKSKKLDEEDDDEIRDFRMFLAYLNSH